MPKKHAGFARNTYYLCWWPLQDADGQVDVDGNANYKGGVLWVCQDCLMGVHKGDAPHISTAPGADIDGHLSKVGSCSLSFKSQFKS